MTRAGSGELRAPGASCPGGGTPGSPSRRRPDRHPPSWSSRPLLAASLHPLRTPLAFSCILLPSPLRSPRTLLAHSALSLRTLNKVSPIALQLLQPAPAPSPCPVGEGGDADPHEGTTRLRHPLSLPSCRRGTAPRWHLPRSSPASHQHRSMVPAVCPGQRRARRRCPRSSAGRGARRCSHGPAAAAPRLQPAGVLLSPSLAKG